MGRAETRTVTPDEMTANEVTAVDAATELLRQLMVAHPRACKRQTPWVRLTPSSLVGAERAAARAELHELQAARDDAKRTLKDMNEWDVLAAMRRAVDEALALADEMGRADPAKCASAIQKALESPTVACHRLLVARGKMRAAAEGLKVVGPKVHRRRWQLGAHDGIGVSILGEGDTFQEVMLAARKTLKVREAECKSKPWM